MTTLTIGRHRAIRSHRRPRQTLGQLARTIRERLTRTEGQPETAGATVPTPERKADMGMMPEGRWLPGTLTPEYRPESEDLPAPVPAHPEWCVCGHDGCPGTVPAAPTVDGPTIFLDPFTVRPYVLQSMR